MVRFIFVEMHMPFKMAPRMLTFLGADAPEMPHQGVEGGETDDMFASETFMFFATDSRHDSLQHLQQHSEDHNVETSWGPGKHDQIISVFVIDELKQRPEVPGEGALLIHVVSLLRFSLNDPRWRRHGFAKKYQTWEKSQFNVSICFNGNW